MLKNPGLPGQIQAAVKGVGGGPPQQQTSQTSQVSPASQANPFGSLAGAFAAFSKLGLPSG